VKNPASSSAQNDGFIFKRGKMNRFTVCVVFMLGVLLAAATACAPASRAPKGAPSSSSAQNASAQSSGGTAANGQRLFAGTCASCHGPDAKGLPNLGKNLTTSAFVKSESDAQLLNFIKTGRPASDPANTTGVDMPPKGGNPALTDANLMDIIAFLRTINR
jgi:mono/diheme cytochrome c family protein